MIVRIISLLLITAACYVSYVHSAIFNHEDSRVVGRVEGLKERITNIDNAIATNENMLREYATLHDELSTKINKTEEEVAAMDLEEHYAYQDALENLNYLRKATDHVSELNSISAELVTVAKQKFSLLISTEYEYDENVVNGYFNVFKLYLTLIAELSGILQGIDDTLEPVNDFVVEVHDQIRQLAKFVLFTSGDPSITSWPDYDPLTLQQALSELPNPPVAEFHNVLLHPVRRFSLLTGNDSGSIYVTSDSVLTHFNVVPLKHQFYDSEFEELKTHYKNGYMVVDADGNDMGARVFVSKFGDLTTHRYSISSSLEAGENAHVFLGMGCVAQDKSGRSFLKGAFHEMLFSDNDAAQIEVSLTASDRDSFFLNQYEMNSGGVGVSEINRKNLAGCTQHIIGTQKAGFTIKTHKVAGIKVLNSSSMIISDTDGLSVNQLTDNLHSYSVTEKVYGVKLSNTEENSQFLFGVTGMIDSYHKRHSFVQGIFFNGHHLSMGTCNHTFKGRELKFLVKVKLTSTGADILIYDEQSGKDPIFVTMPEYIPEPYAFSYVRTEKSEFAEINFETVWTSTKIPDDNYRVACIDDRHCVEDDSMCSCDGDECHETFRMGYCTKTKNKPIIDNSLNTSTIVILSLSGIVTVAAVGGIIFYFRMKKSEYTDIE